MIKARRQIKFKTYAHEDTLKKTMNNQDGWRMDQSQFRMIMQWRMLKNGYIGLMTTT